MLTEKDLSIILQTATKASAELYAGTGNIDAMLEGVSKITGKVMAGMERYSAQVLQGPTAAPQAAAPSPAQAVQNVAQAFPGTVDLSKDDDRWNHLFANWGDWYDNRGDATSTINGGNRPDFRLKADTNVSLFLVSRKYNKTAPDWVFERLGMAKPNLGTQAPPAASGPPQAPAPGTGNPIPF